MGGLFGGKPMRQETPVVSSLRMSTAVQGRPIALVFGKARVSPNCIFYGNFIATQHEQQQGGKGGGGGMTTVNNTYTTGVQMAVCQGPIESYGQVYLAKQKGSLSDFGFSQGLGTATQNPWDYYASSANDTDKSLAYRGVAWIANSALDLGGDPTLPNINVEVQSSIKDTATATGDANPAQIIQALLTNADYGLGWDNAKIANLSSFTDYCRAAGLFFSPAYVDQKPARDLLKQIALLTGADYVWSNNQIKIVPYADGALSGNGATWAPDLSPMYDLTDDDLLEPATMPRGSQSDAHNHVSIKFSDRANEYNESVVDAREQANIEEFGLRKADAIDAPEIVSASTAGVCAQLMLQRGLYVRNKYRIKLPWSFVRLEPMDLVTLTDSGLGLDRQLMRILEKTEDSSGELEFLIEEVPVGAAAVSRFPVEVSTGYAVDYNVSPGNANTPIILELPTTLTNGAHMMAVATSGGIEWGGCDVWVSDDNATYRRIGRIGSKARHGVLSAALPSGATTDTTNHAYVDLSVSKGELLPGTTANANELVTLCWVGGEYFAYRDAALTGANQYNLSYLVRGAHGSTISSHAIGDKFLRIDDAVGRFDASTLTVGKTIYIKLQSFNRYGSGIQDLSAVSPVTYTLAGAPLAAVSSLALEQAFTGTGCKIKWAATPGATSYKIEVYSGASLKRTVTIGDALRYEYTWEDAKADGGPYRSLTFRLKAITDNSESATWAQLTATNDAPAALTGLSVAGGWELLHFKCNKPTDPDFANILIYISTTSGFTPDANTLVYQGPANTVTIDRLNNGTLLVGGTNYYLRATASDLFGSTGLNMSSELTAQPLSAAGAIKPGDIVETMLADLAVGPRKLNIDIGGGNLCQNSSFEIDSNADGLADGWGIYNNGGDITFYGIVAGRRAGTLAQRIAWSTPNTLTKGVYRGATFLPNKTFVLSWYARATDNNVGTTMYVAFNINPVGYVDILNPALTTEWQRYAVRLTWGSSIDNSFYISINGTGHSGALEFDDFQLEQGDVLTGYSESFVDVNSRIDSLSSVVNGNIAAISTEATTRANNDTAIANSVTALTTTVENNTAAISDEAVARSAVDSALADSINSVSARLNAGGDVKEAIVSAQSTATASLNSVNAKYTLKVQAGNFIAGIALSADSGGGESAVAILCDKFAIAVPSAGVGSPVYYPFVVGNVNGVSQVGINGDLIVDGGIVTRSIQVGAATAASSASVTGVNYFGSSTSITSSGVDTKLTMTTTGAPVIIGGVQTITFNTSTMISFIVSDIALYVDGSFVAFLAREKEILALHGTKYSSNRSFSLSARVTGLSAGSHNFQLKNTVTTYDNSNNLVTCSSTYLGLDTNFFAQENKV